MKQTAYEAACRAYCRHVCGQDLAAAPRLYHGDLDIDALVAAAPVPRNHSLSEHRASWAEFRRMFHVWWADFEAQS